jgi:hypothetical protein
VKAFGLAEATHRVVHLAQAVERHGDVKREVTAKK